MRATVYVTAVALLGLVGCGPATTPNANSNSSRNSTNSSTSGNTGVAPVAPDNGATGGVTGTGTGTNSSAEGGRATGGSATGNKGTGTLSDTTVGSDDGRADNTATNKRDRDDNAKTPINQNENQKDIDITAGIRKQIVNTEGMSTNARNVKIITADGKVTLRGPVASEYEKDKIEKFAKDQAGDENVDNQLEVAP